MAKKSRTKARDTQPPDRRARSAPASPARAAPGKRYKACHGAAGGAPAVFVNRPFEGLPSECDVVALRELVPAATAPLTLKGGRRPRACSSCSLLPMAAPAMVRESGQIWLGLQVQHNFGDPARDLGAVLLQGAGDRRAGHRRPDRPARARARGSRTWSPATRSTSPCTTASSTGSPTSRTRTGMAAALEQANAAATPTARLTVGRGGVLDQRRHQGAPALGDARARGRSCSTRSPGCTPPARTTSSPGLALVGHVPRPRPAGPGLGPARRHRRRRRSRSRPSGSPPTSPRRWPTTPP